MIERSLVRRTLAVAVQMSVILGMVLVWSQAANAAPNDAPIVVAQNSPYRPPDLTTVDLPSWVQPFGPVALLPLWAQASLASAVLVGAFFVVPDIVRWARGRFFDGAEGGSS